jgi:hypothetical protein
MDAGNFVRYATASAKRRLSGTKMNSERDIAFGFHSNIPKCCIDFFVEEWEYMYLHDSNPYVRAVDAAKWEYVPCPECLGMGRRAELRICALECGRECWRDYQ